MSTAGRTAPGASRRGDRPEGQLFDRPLDRHSLSFGDHIPTNSHYTGIKLGAIGAYLLGTYMSHRYTRRQTLAAGATLVTTGALAGCLGGGDGGTEPRTVTETKPSTAAHPLGLEHVKLLNEKPADYREYDVNPVGTFSAVDVVWLYVEPVGVTTEAAGAGEERIQLQSTLTVTGPDGRERESTEETFDRDVPSGGTDELYLFFHFSPTTQADSGEYTAELTVRDELADETAKTTTSFTIVGLPTTEPPAFDLENLVFVESEPTGYREYTAVSDAVYGPDDVIWIYFEPTGVGTEQRSDGDEWIELSVRVTTTDPDGNERVAVRKTIERTIPEDRDVDKLYLTASIDLQRPRVGDYDVELDVRDRIGRDGATTTASFTIEDEDLALVETFRSAVEETDAIDVEIDRLRLGESTLRFRYTSSNTYGDDAFDGEVGYIAGVFAAVVDEGLSVDRLRASGQDTDATEFAYRIDAAVAQDYMDGVITESEYVEHVFDSLHVRD